jgi:hypothetical protein
MKSFLSVPGELIEVSELIIEKALSFVSTVLSGYIPHIFLIECKRNADTKEEIVIFEIEIEVGQSRVYDILNK